MAKNEVVVKIRIDDDGNLSAVGKKAEKASKGLDKTSKSAKNADRNMKGVSQQSANSTKNFSKMAQGMTGTLVPAYATLAANVFAISAAFNFFKQAADLRVLEEAQANFASKTGTSLSLLTKRVQEATDGVLNFQDAASAVAIGRASGLSSDQLTELSSLAKSASLALGRDLTDSFNRLIRGVTKAEPELLDELGIILRLDEATANYADSLNLNAKELTAYQRTQAVLNRVLEEGRAKFEDIGGEVNQFAKLGKAFRDLLKDIMSVISPIAEFIAGSLAGNVITLAGAFTLLGKNIAQSLIPAAPALTSVSDAAEAAQKRLAVFAEDMPAKTAESIRSMEALTSREIKDLEKTVNAKNSTILKFSNRNRAAVIRDIKIMKAEHQVLIAENSSGVKRWAATWKAELLTLQATHGKVMGTMKAATLSFSRLFSSLLGVAGIAGLLLTLAGLFRDLYRKYWADQDILKFTEKVEELTDSFKEQNKEVFKLIKGFDKATTASESLIRNANLAANISTAGLEGFGLRDVSVYSSGLAGTMSGSDLTDYGSPRTLEREAVKANKEALELIESTVVSATTLLSLLPESAQQAQKELSSSILQVGSSIDAYNKALKEGTQEEVTAAVENLNDAFKGLFKEMEDAKKTVQDPAGAIKVLQSLPEEFNILLRKMRQGPSEFDSFLQVIDRTSSSLETLKKDLKTLGDLDDENKVILNKLFPGLDLSSTTIETTIQKLGTLREKILEREQDAERGIKAVQIEREKILRGTTSLQREVLGRELQIKEILAEKARIEARIQNFKDSGVKETDTVITNLRQEQELLDVQLGTVRRLQSEFAQLSDATSQAFESGLQEGLASAIKGEETNFKTFILNIAKATLEGAADSLAKILTQKLMGVKGPAETIYDALAEGAQVVGNHIRSALGKPGVSGGAGTSIPSTVPVKGGKSGTFGPFLTSLEDLFDKQSEGGFITKLGKVFMEGGKGIFEFARNLLGLGTPGVGAGSSSWLTTAISSFFRYGGVAEGYAAGGIARGSDAGYPAVLHGTEAVVPLPNNREIPVDLKGAGQNNNVTVNVSVNNEGRAMQDTQATSNQGANLGAAIAAAVQKELQNQKRSGGILNPYGAA